MDGCVKGWMDEWMGGWTDGRTGGWMDGRTDVRTNAYGNAPLYLQEPPSLPPDASALPTLTLSLSLAPTTTPWAIEPHASGIPYPCT